MHFFLCQLTFVLFAWGLCEKKPAFHKIGFQLHCGFQLFPPLFLIYETHHEKSWRQDHKKLFWGDLYVAICILREFILGQEVARKYWRRKFLAVIFYHPKKKADVVWCGQTASSGTIPKRNWAFPTKHLFLPIPDLATDQKKKKLELKHVLPHPLPVGVVTIDLSVPSLFAKVKQFLALIKPSTNKATPGLQVGISKLRTRY